MKEFFKNFTKIIFIFMLSSNPLSSQESIKIGLLVPLSGEMSNIGKSIIHSVRMGVNKINNKNLIIIPRDTKSNQDETLEIVKELYSKGVRIFIGPVFNKNLNGLSIFEDATFLSLSNKILGNPNNVIASGVNAKSQFDTIKKYLKINDLNKTLVLIPKKNYKNEIEEAIKRSKLKTKKIFYYDAEPTKLTKQIEKVTKYKIRKNNLKDEIKRVENSDEENKEKKLEFLNKKDTLGKIGYDSIIIADFSESLKSVTTSLLYTDVSPKKVTFISLNQWFDETLFREKTSQPIAFPSINRENFFDFRDQYKKIYNEYPSHIAILGYDLVGLIYYLLLQNNFIINDKLFTKNNKFKGITGIFEIKNNKINHILTFYKVEDGEFKKIF
tara:strand:- start:1710 stop:2861 length:1152 start_codon:yes stop_codon:yes gene_type:complete